jgi:hypothetical protein
VRGPAQLLARIGTSSALRVARLLLLSARQMGEELFDGEPARLLLAGNACTPTCPPARPSAARTAC